MSRDRAQLRSEKVRKKSEKVRTPVGRKRAAQPFTENRYGHRRWVQNSGRSKIVLESVCFFLLNRFEPILTSIGSSRVRPRLFLLVRKDACVRLIFRRRSAQPRISRRTPRRAEATRWRRLEPPARLPRRPGDSSGATWWGRATPRCAVGRTSGSPWTPPGASDSTTACWRPGRSTRDACARARCSSWCTASRARCRRCSSSGRGRSRA